jgi:hypothetical protein
MAKAAEGDNPAAQKLADGLYQFTLLDSGSYTISAWEDLSPQRAPSRRSSAACAPPARLDVSPVLVQGSDSETKEITLTFASPDCGNQAQ